LFETEKTQLKPCGVCSYDVATVRQVTANSRFRVTLDTNRYSVPARLAGASLTMKIHPARILLVHQDQIVAEHERCFDRHKDIEHPDHAQPLLDQRRMARGQKLLDRFLSLCPQAPLYYEQLGQRRLNAQHHVQKSWLWWKSTGLRRWPARSPTPMNSGHTVANTSPTSSSNDSASCLNRGPCI
jgi:hypothetical protein